MADAFWMKVRDVKWADYETSEGTAVSMPTILKNLGSRKLPRATRASHQAWTALCGGGKVYSAIVPSVPLMLEVFMITAPEIQDGILDIFQRAKTVEIKEDWAEDLNFVLLQAQDLLSAMRPPKDEIVASKISDFCIEKS